MFNKLIGWFMTLFYIGLWLCAIIALVDLLGNFGYITIQ